MDGKINVDDLITHTLQLEDINEAFDLMHEGESIRSVVKSLTAAPHARSSEHRCFDGTCGFYRHASEAAGARCALGVFVPPQARERPVPVLYFLAGLTCTEEKFVAKAGAQRFAAELGLVLVAPDTSPRGADFPGDDATLGLRPGRGLLRGCHAGAVGRALPHGHLRHTRAAGGLGRIPARADREGIFGHSMGGHGAL